MLDFLKRIIKPKYETLNNIDIIEKNILFNYSLLKKQQNGAEIFPVLKSNAYGHGLKQISQILNKTDAKMLIVDSFPEAQIVYKNSNKKVLIISEMPLRAYRYCNFHRTEFCVYNISTLKYLTKLNKDIKIHLFINTGMNREGIQGLRKFLNETGSDIRKVRIVGLCSHLASAELDSNLNEKQQKRFFEELNVLRENKIFPKYIHLGNSSGIFTLKSDKLTAFRAGISLYGYNTFQPGHYCYDRASSLKPALRVTSTITSTQSIEKGDSVSYNEAFISKTNREVGTIPFGYYEGLDRRYSNKLEFLVNPGREEFYAKILGKVCMNITCISCSANTISVGDRVEIISEKDNKKNSIKNISKQTDIIPYEVLVKLRDNIRRNII